MLREKISKYIFKFYLWFSGKSFKDLEIYFYNSYLIKNHGKYGKFSDIVGKRYGRLVVKEYIGIRGKKSYYRCLCDCGNYKDVKRDYLRFGSARSCGCLRRETTPKNRWKNHKKYE